MAGIIQLAQISEKLKNNEDVSPVTVRTFLSWFGAQRRSFWNVFTIRSALKNAGIETTPDFESAYIDSDIRFVVASSENKDLSEEVPDATLSPADIPPIREPSAAGTVIIADPTYRISKLEAANKLPVSISPDATLENAVTVMMASDFSQLPVITSKRDIKGIISWSAIG
jgi:hypothetical protein